MIARRLAGAVLTAAGAGGLTACILSAFSGMRDVMRADGGSCASGGPYVSVHPCPAGDMRLLMIGILGGLAATAVYSASTSALGRPASLAGLLAWTALFGTLGWTFISMDLHPPAHQPASGAWLLSGGAFWLMALGGLVLFLLAVGRDLRYAGRPDPAVTGMAPLVMAAVIPGLPVPAPLQGGAGGWALGGGPAAAAAAAMADPLARRRGLLQAGIWLITSLAGAGAGLALSSSLIAMLR